MKHILLKLAGTLTVFCLCISFSFAQSGGKTVTGVVTNEETGEPIPGATVLEKGTSNGTATDLDGNFKLNLTTESPVLTVSFIGYSSKEVSVGNASELSVSLSEDMGQLEEVVVVGYGTQKRSDITGSVASVPKERLSNLPVTNLTQAIQGTTAGLTVNQGSSVPGSTGGMQIRGVNSINANTSPFIVVDGSPYFGTLNDLNANDIESIEILKDASAVAIYGTRGANGVILVTTKRGDQTDGTPKINYSGYMGFESMSHVLEPMGPDAYVQKYADYLTANNQPQTNILPNASEVENYEAGITTDWLDQATQPGRISEHNLSISGGTEKIQYYVSGSHLKQKGVVKGYQYARTNFRTNIDATITNWLKVGTSDRKSVV